MNYIINRLVSVLLIGIVLLSGCNGGTADSTKGKTPDETKNTGKTPPPPIDPEKLKPTPENRKQAVTTLLKDPTAINGIAILKAQLTAAKDVISADEMLAAVEDNKNLLNLLTYDDLKTDIAKVYNLSSYKLKEQTILDTINKAISDNNKKLLTNLALIVTEQDLEKLDPAKMKDLLSQGYFVDKLNNEKQEELAEEAIDENKPNLFKSIYQKAANKDQLAGLLIEEKLTDFSSFADHLNDWGIDITTAVDNNDKPILPSLNHQDLKDLRKVVDHVVNTKGAAPFFTSDAGKQFLFDIVARDIDGNLEHILEKVIDKNYINTARGDNNVLDILLNKPEDEDNQRDRIIAKWFLAGARPNEVNTNSLATLFKAVYHQVPKQDQKAEGKKIFQILDNNYSKIWEFIAKFKDKEKKDILDMLMPKINELIVNSDLESLKNLVTSKEAYLPVLKAAIQQNKLKDFVTYISHLDDALELLIEDYNDLNDPSLKKALNTIRLATKSINGNWKDMVNRVSEEVSKKGFEKAQVEDLLNSPPSQEELWSEIDFVKDQKMDEQILADDLGSLTAETASVFIDNGLFDKLNQIKDIKTFAQHFNIVDLLANKDNKKDQRLNYFYNTKYNEIKDKESFYNNIFNDYLEDGAHIGILANNKNAIEDILSFVDKPGIVITQLTDTYKKYDIVVEWILSTKSNSIAEDYPQKLAYLGEQIIEKSDDKIAEGLLNAYFNFLLKNQDKQNASDNFTLLKLTNKKDYLFGNFYSYDGRNGKMITVVTERYKNPENVGNNQQQEVINKSALSQIEFMVNNLKPLSGYGWNNYTQEAYTYLLSKEGRMRIPDPFTLLQRK